MKKNFTKFLLALLVVGGGFQSCKKAEVDLKTETENENFFIKDGYIVFEDIEALMLTIDELKENGRKSLIDW